SFCCSSVQSSVEVVSSHIFPDLRNTCMQTPNLLRKFSSSSLTVVCFVNTIFPNCFLLCKRLSISFVEIILSFEFPLPFKHGSRKNSILRKGKSLLNSF